jgi:pimeloyl-ACP methyl ester carboxylesterase
MRILHSRVSVADGGRRRILRRWLASLVAVGLIAASRPAMAQMDPEVLSPVPVVQDGRLNVRTAQGEGVAVLHVTRDWNMPQPGIRRAVVVIPGWPRRDLHAGEHAAAQAGVAARDTVIVTPQFLIQSDVVAHGLPGSTLRWGPDDWVIGRDATAPAPVSSFDVIDAILARLGDRQVFPNLGEVVIAGHSSGGQFVQHYAVVGHGPEPLLAEGIHVRYVIANPSTYLYLTAARPVVPAPGCISVDRWRYGVSSGVPRYARPSSNLADLRAAYLAKDITYLLGMDDNDPNHHQLDRSCAGEAQGSTRLQRGLFYANEMRASGASAQTVLEVPGVGHTSWGMFGSPCGVFALFGSGTCAATPDTLMGRQ